MYPRTVHYVLIVLLLLFTPFSSFAQYQPGEFIDEYIHSRNGGLELSRHMTLGPDGHLYTSSTFSHEVLRFDRNNGHFLDAFVTLHSGNLQLPLGLTFGPDGNLYVVSSGTKEILRYNGTTGAFIDAFVSADENSAEEPIDLAFGPDENLYVNDRSSMDRAILRYDGRTGAFIDSFIPSGSRGIYNSELLAFGPDGDLYVSHKTSVSRLDGVTGQNKGVFVGSSSSFLVTGIAFAPDGTFYVSRAPSIFRYSSTGSYLGEFVNYMDLPSMYFLASPLISDDGFMYVGSIRTHEFARLNAETGDFIDRWIYRNPGEPDSPKQLLFLPKDKLLLSNGFPGAYPDHILQYDASSSQFLDTLITTPFHATGDLLFNGLSAMALGPDNQLYVTGETSNRIYKFKATTGEFLGSFVKPANGYPDNPRYLILGPDTNFYLSNTSTNEVIRYHGTTGEFLGVFVQANAGGLMKPEGLLFGPDGHLYVTSQSGEVLRYDGTTGNFIDAFVTELTFPFAPRDLAFGPDGNLYVSSFDDTIYQFDGLLGDFIQIYVQRNSERLINMEHFTFGPDGNLYVVSNYSDSVLRYAGPSLNSVSNQEENPIPFEAEVPVTYPNPFKNQTHITYTIPLQTEVSIKVYDLTGRLVSELFQGIQSAGRHQITFDGTSLPSGVYYYRILSEDFYLDGNMILAR